MFATYLISPPAQKDLSPAPVIIITLILSSAPAMSIAVYNSAATSLSRAFKTSGLLIFIIATSSSMLRLTHYVFHDKSPREA